MTDTSNTIKHIASPLARRMAKVCGTWRLNSTSSSSTCPHCGARSPTSMDINVDLPAPLGPRMAVKRPAFSATFTVARRGPLVTPTPKLRHSSVDGFIPCS